MSLGVKEWVSDGVEFLAAKSAKVRKGLKPETRNPKLETRNQKPETDQPTGKTFCRRGTMHGEEGAGES